MTDTGDFGRRSEGKGIRRIGKRMVDKEKKKPWVSVSPESYLNKIVKQLEYFSLTVAGGNEVQRRYELARRVINMPQIEHMNMVMLAASLYIIDKMDDEPLDINTITDEDVERVSEQLETLDDKPALVYLAPGIRSDLIRYISVIQNHFEAQELP